MDIWTYVHMVYECPYAKSYFLMNFIVCRHNSFMFPPKILIACEFLFPPLTLREDIKLKYVIFISHDRPR